MPSLSSKKECANFLLTKRAQGFISDKTWNKILESWRKCSSLEECLADDGNDLSASLMISFPDKSLSDSSLDDGLEECDLSCSSFSDSSLDECKL